LACQSPESTADDTQRAEEAKEQQQQQQQQQRMPAGATWRDRIDALYKSSAQGLRVAVYGCKHDASNFETLIRSACSRGKFYADEPLIDTALDSSPKVLQKSRLLPALVVRLHDDVSCSSSFACSYHVVGRAASSALPHVLTRRALVGSSRAPTTSLVGLPPALFRTF
jgi:hypothetical protein